MRRPSVFIPLLVCLLAACFPAAALAQGTSGMVPDPISGTDIDAYAGRLGLSLQQRLAVDALHDDYLNEFRNLREKEIESFLERSGNVMRSFMFSPDADEAKKTMGELERVIGKIRNLDDDFFSRMTTVLVDEQLPMIERVRQMRTRQRYGAGVVRFAAGGNPGARVDLSRLVSEIDLAPEERGRIEPSLAGYEAQLTTSTRNLFDATQKSMMDMIERMAEMTSAFADAAEGGNRGGGFNRIREIWTESTASLRDETTRISALNWRSYRQWRELMSADADRALRNRYFESAYRNVYRGERAVYPMLERAAEWDALTPEQRTTIAAMRDELEARLDRLANEMIDLTEEIRSDAAGGAFFSRERGDSPEQTRLDAAEERRDEANTRAKEQLLALIGAAKMETLEKTGGSEASGEFSITAVPNANGRMRVRSGRPMRGAAVPVEGTSSVARGASDPMMPPRLDRAEWQDIADALGFTEDQSLIADTLHEEYLESYRTIVADESEPLFEQLSAARRWRGGRGGNDDADNTAAVTADQLEALYAQRRALHDRILRLESTLFNDIGTVVLDAGSAGAAAMPAVRRARERRVYAVRDDTGGGLGFVLGRLEEGAAAERRIDLCLLLNDERVGADTDSVDASLTAYETEFIALLRNRYDQAFDTRLKLDRMMLEMGSGFRREMFAQVEGLTAELQALDAQIVELNRRSLEQVASALPSDTARTLRAQYRRAAHPGIYDDPDNTEAFFRAALALPDLSPDQREGLSTQLAEYLGPYEALCKQMVEIETAPREESGNGWGGMNWQRMQERRNAMERMRFERRELSLKVRRRLASVLSESQRQTIGLQIDL